MKNPFKNKYKARIEKQIESFSEQLEFVESEKHDNNQYKNAREYCHYSLLAMKLKDKIDLLKSLLN
jgi:hypothetical protein